MANRLDPETILYAILGAFLIGLTNLVVSFSITLCIALKSRGTRLTKIPGIAWNVVVGLFHLES